MAPSRSGDRDKNAIDCSVVNSIDRDNRSGTFNNQGLRDGRRGKEYARWGVVRLVRAARDEILHEEQSSDTIAVPSVLPSASESLRASGVGAPCKLRLRAPLESAGLRASSLEAALRASIPRRGSWVATSSLGSCYQHESRRSSQNPIEQRRECCYKRRRSTVNST